MWPGTASAGASRNRPGAGVYAAGVTNTSTAARSQCARPQVAGAGLGYYLGKRTNIRPGDAALINSALLWGTAAGGLFAVSFAVRLRAA